MIAQFSSMIYFALDLGSYANIVGSFLSWNLSTKNWLLQNYIDSNQNPLRESN